MPTAVTGPPSDDVKVRPAGSTVVQGTVKWFDTDRGFGFINSPAHREDIFCHQSQIIGPGWHRLVDRQPVEFVLVIRDSKPVATFISQPGNVPIEPPEGSSPAWSVTSDAILQCCGGVQVPSWSASWRAVATHEVAGRARPTGPARGPVQSRRREIGRVTGPDLARTRDEPANPRLMLMEALKSSSLPRLS